MNAKIIKFIGFSGSGKTTAIEKIVRKLTCDGVKVATIKHDVHEKLHFDDILSKIDDVDIILIEGYSSEEGYPCISVARKDTMKGIKGEFDKLNAIISDYSKNELISMGYKGVSLDINNIDEIINYIINI